MGWGGALDKILAHFTPVERRRKIKERIDELERQEKAIKNKKATPALSRKLSVCIAKRKRLQKKLRTY